MSSLGNINPLQKTLAVQSSQLQGLVGQSQGNYNSTLPVPANPSVIVNISAAAKDQSASAPVTTNLSLSDAYTYLSTHQDATKITISDSNANIKTNILNGVLKSWLPSWGARISSIAINDGNLDLSMTYAQASGTSSGKYADVLAKISSYKLTLSDPITIANLIPALKLKNLKSLAVGDSWANISNSANISSLEVIAKKGFINAISVNDDTTDAALTLSSLSSNADVFGAVSNKQFTISDTAVNIKKYINQLGVASNNGAIKTVTITDSNNLTLTPAEVAKNFGAISKLSDFSKLSITGTAQDKKSQVITMTTAQYSDQALNTKFSGFAKAVKFDDLFNSYAVNVHYTGSNGSFSSDGSIDVRLKTYGGSADNFSNVKLFKFKDIVVYGDSGNPNVNAILSGGTKKWWYDNTQASPGASLSTTKIADGLYALNPSSSKTTLTYSFLSTDSSTGFQAMNADQQKAVKDALAYISSLVNIKFTLINSPTANLNFGTNNQNGVSGGYANLPNNGSVKLMLANDQSYNDSLTAGLNHGGAGWMTLIHEIGHTLGLKHPGNYNAGSSPGPTPTTDPPWLPSERDSTRFTVMSYTEANSDNLGTSSGYVRSYMTYDIAALQFLYGVNSKAASTNSWQTSSFNANWSGLETVYSNAAKFDASVLSSNNLFDLRGGAYSTINLSNVNSNFNLNNVGLAYGSKVSSVLGGLGKDITYASSDSSGAVIDGGAGSDTLYLPGSQGDWTSTSNKGMTIYSNALLNEKFYTKNIETISYYDESSLSLTHSLSIFA